MHAPEREADTNRMLRRVDWRFLLPDPAPRRVRSFAGGALARAVASTWPDAAEHDNDVVVMVDPDDRTLKAGFDALRAGGTCYTEWYAPRGGSAARIRRRLRDAGFSDATLYWAWPQPSSSTAQVWVPLDAPNVVRYFVRHRPPVRGFGPWLRHRVRRRVWGVGVRSGWVRPLCTVARKAPDSAPRKTVYDVTAWGKGATPTTLRSLLLTNGARSTNKIVALVFADNESLPRIAVKMARVPEAAAFVRREAMILRAVAERTTVGGVPRVVYEGDDGGVVTLGETALHGFPVFTYLNQNTYADLAARATDWVIALGEPRTVHPRAAWWERLVASVVATFEASWGAVIDAAMLTEARGYLEALGTLPLVCEHRDFGPWNVLLNADGAIEVLDWEGAELDGLPLLDLVYFLAYLAFFLDGAVASNRYDASYARLLHATTLTGRTFAACLARYADALGLAPTDLRALRVLVWMLHARSEYRRLEADAGGSPTSEQLREGVFVRLWQREMEHARKHQYVD